MFQKPSRAVHTVWIHCSAASRPSVTAAEVDKWHKDRGWSGIGYHYFIRTDGTLEKGRDLEKRGAHVKGYNTGSIGICLNGLHEGDFTEAQFDTLRRICNEIDDAYDGQIRFRGHREVAAKLCPVFDYKKVLQLTDEGFIKEKAPATPVPEPKPEVDDEMPKEIKTPVSQKPVVSLKEVGTCAPVLTGWGAILQAVEGPTQWILAGTFSVAVLGVLGLVGYRIIARKNKTR